mgnify:CR=1 FL=1
MTEVDEIQALKKGIIFDLDGTLWDSSYQVGIAWNTVFARTGVGIVLTPEKMTVMMGRTVPEIGEAMLGFIEQPRRDDILKQCCDEENLRLNEFGGKVYPHVLETLEKLSRRYPLFIVSNCEDGYIESFLNYHKADKFISDTECIGRTGLAKAGNIKLIIERNRLDSSVYVGDTARDMLAAHEAGIPFIHASYGFGHAPDAEYSIDSFTELPKLIEGIFSK